MRIRESHPEKLAEGEFIAHPRKEMVKVDGMLLPNAVWSLTDAQRLYPELTQVHFDSMSLKQKTQLAGQLFAIQVQNKRIDRQHLEQTNPYFFSAYENAKSTLDKQAKEDKDKEVAETNFDKPEISIDLLVEKGGTAVRGITHFVSHQRREQDQLAQLDLTIALSEPQMNGWIDQEVSSYLENF